MKVLALDTSSTKEASCAIVEDGTTLVKLQGNEGKDHSQTLMPMIKEIFDKSSLQLKDMDLLSCGKGPGSFTGLRIGIATIDAFKDVTNIPVCGVSSLEALAYGAIIKKGKRDCKILSMVSAKYENVYFAVYRFHNGHLSLYKNPEVANISDTLNFIDLQEPLFIVGDYIPEKMEPIFKVIEDREMAEGKDIIRHEYITNLPSMAECIGIAAEEKYNLGTIADLNHISPYYLRKPLAERQKDPDYFEDSEVSVLNMTSIDLDYVKMNYEKFTNIWSLKVLEEDFKNSKFLVAKRNDEVLGFLSYRIVLDELEIMNIVVREDYRRKGVASKMLSNLIIKEDYEKINLEVNINNIAAITLYKKFGFMQVGNRKKYYNGSEDAILMSI